MTLSHAGVLPRSTGHKATVRASGPLRVLRKPAAAAQPISAGAWRVHPALAAALFFLVALVSRWRVFGDPMITGVDEQFYVFMAERILGGAVPYIDIWDRKPVGLFVIYAAGALFGNVLIGSQILALLAVTGTATILFFLARRIARDSAALLSGLIYIVWLTLAGGEGGQSPVFYNLLVAGAVAIVLRAREAARGRAGDLRKPGSLAMLLIGLGLQIKYSVVFEGVFLGVVLLVLAWSRGRRLGLLAIDAALWIGCALAPTALAALGYAVAGHFQDWLFANFLSIGLRNAEPDGVIVRRLMAVALMMAPMVVALALRLAIARRPRDPARIIDLRLLDGWALVAVLAVAAFGTWYGHYMLPLFAPLAVVVAPLGERWIGRLCLVGLFAYGAVAGQVLAMLHIQQRGDRHLLESATAAVAGQRNCLLIFDGPSLLYNTSKSCLASTRPFPEHLRLLNEAGAIGIDEVAELRRIMAARPDHVMLREPGTPEDNPVTRAVLLQALRQGYVRTWHYPMQGRDYVIYTRREISGGRSLPDKAPDAVAGSPAKACRPAVPPPWSQPVARVSWHLAPVMGACL